ncbi:MAG: hypothetical protein WCX65_13800 [bacterium]
MKKIIICVFLITLAAAGPALCDDVNIAPRCRVLASEPANAAWESKNIVDQDIGPTKGWLGIFDAVNPPWARFVIPYPVKITKILIMPASYTELERRRYSRPKTVSVVLKGDKPSVKEFTLLDKEDGFQELAINEDNVYELSIVINDVYPSVKYPNQTGFQEVEIMIPPEVQILTPEGGLKNAEGALNPAEEARKILNKTQEAASETPDGKKAEPAQKGELSQDEQEILDLLRELLQRLEQKFREE